MKEAEETGLIEVTNNSGKEKSRTREEPEQVKQQVGKSSLFISFNVSQYVFFFFYNYVSLFQGNLGLEPPHLKMSSKAI